jgi:uncharacterized lipoprotein
VTLTSLVGYLLGVGTTSAAWILQRLYFPDLLNRRSQHRGEQSKLREEERKYTREDSAIRGRLQAALINQCRAMQRVFIGGDFPIAYWKELHAELDGLIKTDDASRALGPDYVKFADTLESDRWTIGYVENLKPEKLQRGYTLQAAADVVKRFSVLLELLDDEQSARRYGSSADTALTQAELILRQPPGS